MAILSYQGYCPVCESHVDFVAHDKWYRDYLRCQSCQSCVRERAINLILDEVSPNWRMALLHESSPGPMAFSTKLARECRNYVGTQFFPDVPAGGFKDGFRSESLENQTFADDSFDLVITLDVMEHVFHPDRVYRDVWRTLKPGGYYLHTFPILKSQSEAAIPRAVIATDGTVTHLLPEQYHGNPIDESGSLVTIDYGYDIAAMIAEWAPFDVRIIRFSDMTRGILGEFTDVVVCRKRADF